MLVLTSAKPTPPHLSLQPDKGSQKKKKKKKKNPTMSPSSVTERPTTPSRAGITVTADGRQIIPSSIRADGSARREILVRPGYRPPEDVEVYKNRNAEAWKNRGSGGVPGAAPVEKKPDVTQTGASLKNAKRKARKKAKESESREDDAKERGAKGSGSREDDTKEHGAKKSESREDDAKEHDAKENEARRNETSGKEAGEGRPPAQEPETPTSSEPAAEGKEKLAKAVRKKLRQANELKTRHDGGETLLPEQLEKVIRINELVRQLNALGFEE